ncbi:MAG: FAD-dependent oxidoreductase [Planctomycetota bacterium]
MMQISGSFLTLILLWITQGTPVTHPSDQSPAPLEADLVVYDATPAGISAAIAGRRAGLEVILISPHEHLGGLTTSGLGATDVGAGSTVGGIGREFYQALREHYDSPQSWSRQKKSDFKGRGHKDGEDVAWTFEPHIAEATIESMLKKEGVRVLRNSPIDRTAAATTRSIPWRLIGLRLKKGGMVRGKVFIDASYEGDLLPLAQVPYTVGRESNDQYEETLNGVQNGRATKHQFKEEVSARVDPQDPDSPWLPGLLTPPHAEDGTADRGVQAYCFRMCLTDDPENQIPWKKPADYDASQYELLLRQYDQGSTFTPWHIVHMPNRKSDVNNNGAVSTDFIGGNIGYVEGSDEDRARIYEAHRSWQQGLIWTLAHHPRVPEKVRKSVNRWQPAADEFTDHDGWPWRLYVREGRRMVSKVVMNENHVRAKVTVDDPVGLASYGMDSHNVHRRVIDGKVRNEGDIQVYGFEPWPISYRAIVPPPQTCSNLIVPVAISASHIAFGSARMEPVFFVLGESAGIAAAEAIRKGTAVQSLPYDELRPLLDKAGQRLQFQR